MSVFRVGNKSTVNNFPNIRPTLDLDFANSKTLDPRIDFTRASGGSYVDVNGIIKYAGVNEARFDHDPETGESLGLLIEESRTNLLLHSNSFDTTWTKTNSSFTDASGTAPDGTNTAWELKDTDDDSIVLHGLLQSIVFTSGTTYTLTAWMKSGTLTEGFLAFPSSAFGIVLFARFNFLTGAVIQVAPGVTASSRLFSNGWVRVSITSTATVTSSGSLQIRITNGSNSYQGTGTGTILIWGAQLEVGSFPTSYIPTQASSRTRATDVAQITGKNFSNFYNQNEGTAYVSFLEFGGTGSGPFWFNPGSNLRGIAFRRTSNNTLSFHYRQVSPTPILVEIPDSIPIQKHHKVSGAFNNNILSVSVNGSNVESEYSIQRVIPDVDRLRIGFSRIAGTAPFIWCGTISRFTYFPKRLPDSNLQALTR